MIYTHLIAAVVAAFAAWAFQGARYSAELAEQALAHKTAELRDAGELRRVERATATKYQGALNDARTREALLRTDLDRLHRTADGLREQSAEAGRRLAAAPPAAVLEYATALGAVHDDCRAAYADLAAKAAGHASDVRTLREGWPWR